MNPLAQYFDQATEDNPTKLASRIGKSPSTITRVVKGERRPSFGLAKLIEGATGGKVMARDLLAHFLAAEGEAA